MDPTALSHADFPSWTSRRPSIAHPLHQHRWGAEYQRHRAEIPGLVRIKTRMTAYVLCCPPRQPASYRRRHLRPLYLLSAAPHRKAGYRTSFKLNSKGTPVHLIGFEISGGASRLLDSFFWIRSDSTGQHVHALQPPPSPTELFHIFEHTIYLPLFS
ncbi:hypothetical protein ASPZODRAFT_959491 [Penicilliopsis zonata CBS 506.65]|uniref:Uncharacterized protein n=1 Tax=Penicilliopsis zonata CBS 506.65 TaxID=1073090 RepID=A0A1L9SQZ0_9EURO|nr:hypothetical protein ASPZODRAFT_959491 [Penicilliopsis zonata CBS 506.65]OJJ49514.1 hypothetical protein ASPZODRAFT_959491 [Penicilliopsis zonata CBS 506.65]